MTAKFCDIHGDGITISADETEAVAEYDILKNRVVFLAEPINAGETVSFTVTDPKLGFWTSGLTIGITANSPETWDRQTRPNKMSWTWCVNLSRGVCFLHGTENKTVSKVAEKWLNGASHVALTFSKGRTLSLTIDESTELIPIFKHLPKQTFWVVVDVCVKGLSVTGLARDHRDSKSQRIVKCISNMFFKKITEVPELSKERESDINLQVVEQDREVPVDIEEADIRWIPHELQSNDTEAMQVVKTKKKRSQHIYKEVLKEEAYKVSSPMRGKVCIISVPTFEVPWLNERPEFNLDRQKLAKLWQGFGLTVLMPETEECRSLTAREIEKSIKEFGALYSTDDEIAIVCLSSYGKGGRIYGCDGKTVLLGDLQATFSDASCPKMANKPKLWIVSHSDKGYSGHVSTMDMDKTKGDLQNKKPDTTSADTLSVLYTAPESLYDCNDPGTSLYGSRHISHLANVFSSRCNEKDVVNLLAMVNKILGDNVDDTGNQEGGNNCLEQHYKQAFRSEVKCNLRKSLYLLA